MTGYVLYGRRGSGSACVEAVLAELAIPHEFVEVPRDADSAVMKTLTRLNPRGQVPVLELPDGTIATESVAIMSWLADSHPEARLVPPAGTRERLQHDRWLSFLLANVYEGEMRWHYPQRYTTLANGGSGVRKAADAYVLRHYALIEAALRAGSIPRGNPVNLFEIFLWMLTTWHSLGRLNSFKAILSLALKVAGRPRIAPVHRANNLENV